MELKNEVKSEVRDKEKPKFVSRTLAEVQRAKLEKLMKNPDKPVIIPTYPKEKDFSNSIPSFVRNVMGSSAGAGSGEFHVYRHLRRKEYARQKHIQDKSRREELDDAFQDKLEKNRLLSEEKTAKKRAKRLKQKQKQKNKNKKPKTEDKPNSESDDNEDDDEAEVEEKEDEEMETSESNVNVTDDKVPSPAEESETAEIVEDAPIPEDDNNSEDIKNDEALTETCKNDKTNR